MPTSPRGTRPYTFYKMTMSTCPECLKVVQAQVVFQENKVYFLKHCPAHGHSKALVSEDAVSPAAHLPADHRGHRLL